MGCILRDASPDVKPYALLPLRILQFTFADNFRLIADNKTIGGSIRLLGENTIMTESIPSASEDPSRAPIPAGHPVTTWNLAGAERVESALRRPKPPE